MIDELLKHVNMNSIQLVMDAVLCTAVLFAMWRMNRSTPKPLIDRTILVELQQLIQNSHAATTSYLQAVDEGRKSAKEVAFLLADREKRAKELLDKINKRMSEAATVPVAGVPSVGKMAAAGMAPEEIAKTMGMNEGEIKLMIGLAAKKGFA